MKSMRKWLAKFVAVLLIMGLMPVTPGMTAARADTTVTIDVNSNGKPTGTPNGWTYDSVNNTLTLNSGYTFTIANNYTCLCIVTNNGTISDGAFSNIVTNNSGGTISGGRFNAGVINNSGGMISGGTFRDLVINNGTISGGAFSNIVTNNSGGTISGGTFDGSVTNNSGGTISNGSFISSVTNSSGGTISGGTFRGSVTNDGTISGGTFYGSVTNNGTIIDDGLAGSAPTFNGSVTNSGTISIGTFNDDVTNSSGGTILDGTFNDAVTNSSGGTIGNGTFNAAVTNSSGGTIRGGTFSLNGKVINSGMVSDGHFDNGVTNNSGGTISGGTFYRDVTNNGTISGGYFVNITNNNGTILYTVHFDAKGGYGSTKDEVFTYGQPQALTKNGYWKYNLAFNNWNTKEDGTGTTYGDGDTVNISFPMTGSPTFWYLGADLYAQWKQGTGGISVDRNNLAFADTVEGEEPPAAMTLNVTNTGNIGLNLNTTGAPDFTAAFADTEGFPPAYSKTLSIRPNSNLAPGDYNESLTVFDFNGAITPVTISLSYTVLSTDDTPVNLVNTVTGDSLNASRNAIYASPADATESDAEIEYCDMSVGTDTASPSDAKASQHFTLGKSQKLKSFTWDGVTYTKWKVFLIKDTTTCKYIYVMHNQAYEILFDGNGGTADTASGKTDEDGYLTFLPAASRSGFTFAGWYTDKTGGTQVSKSTKFTSDSTLYAHWTTAGGNTGSGSGGGTSYTGQWIKNDIGWWYRNADGTWPSNTWKQINGKWYHFDRNGYMQTGWILDNGKWYYLDPATGAMVTGLLKAPDGYWYYFRADGSMAVGDVTVDGKQRHFNDRIPPEPTYVSDPEKGTWKPNGNTDLPYGAETK